MTETMETLALLAKAMLGMGLVMGTWLAVQEVARRRSGCLRDHDTLDYMAHGCGGCVRAGSGGCKNRRLDKEQEHLS